MSLKLIVLLSLVCFVDLPLPHFVQFSVPRLLLLVEGVWLSWRLGCLLPCDSIQINRAYAGTHRAISS